MLSKVDLSLVLLTLCSCAFAVRYEPTWESIDSRPIPAWYDEVKLGIFIHFGVFAVPSWNPNGSTAWMWYYWKALKEKIFIDFMTNNYGPEFTYADFASQLTMEFFNADEWANIFALSGAEYIALTSKHHEGFCNWPSKYSFNWNSMDVGPKRDVVGELANAIRNKTKLHFGLYHSLYEWFHPLYLQDKANGYTTQNFVNDKTMPELYEIVNKYKPEVIWSDGDWEASSDYWQSKEFIAWLYNDSPVKDTIVINDRWGNDSLCKHGGYITCSDRYQPGVLIKRKWENAMTIDSKAWGFRRDAPLTDFLTSKQLIDTFIETVSCGGNMLMNVGPTKEGTITPIFQERLLDIGAWKFVNNEGIRGSRPWIYQNDTLTPNVW
ncbi:alpha-L-fucosidase isoform X2 [Patella vulgata]|nr:alpha-L-fucosidase isoform X2 [Patella vulgata]